MSCQQTIYKYDKNKLHDNQIIAKKDSIIGIKLKNFDESFQLLERKKYIKYLGVMIDEHLIWKNQISFIRARISRNIGITSKSRYYLSIQQLKQIYYSLI